MNRKANSILKTWFTSFHRKNCTVFIMRVARRSESQLSNLKSHLERLMEGNLQQDKTKLWINRLNRAILDLLICSAPCKELLYHHWCSNHNQLVRLKLNQASLLKTWIQSILKEIVFQLHIALRNTFRMPALTTSHSTVHKSNSRMLGSKSRIHSDKAHLREQPVNIVLHIMQSWMAWRHLVELQLNNNMLFSKGQLKLMSQRTRRSYTTWLRLNNRRLKTHTQSCSETQNMAQQTCNQWNSQQ